jgi:hypothetical protein
MYGRNAILLFYSTRYKNRDHTVLFKVLIILRHGYKESLCPSNEDIYRLNNDVFKIDHFQMYYQYVLSILKQNIRETQISNYFLQEQYERIIIKQL